MSLGYNRNIGHRQGKNIELKQYEKRIDTIENKGFRNKIKDKLLNKLKEKKE